MTSGLVATPRIAHRFDGIAAGGDAHPDRIARMFDEGPKQSRLRMEAQGQSASASMARGTSADRVPDESPLTVLAMK